MESARHEAASRRDLRRRWDGVASLEIADYEQRDAECGIAEHIDEVDKALVSRQSADEADDRERRVKPEQASRFGFRWSRRES